MVPIRVTIHVLAMSSPHGRPVSGRLWKDVETKRASAVRVAVEGKSWAERSRSRGDLKVIKAREEELLERRKERLAAAKLKREEKKARKQRNEMKNSSFQVISNEQTMKKLNKKQLRQVKRTRMSKEGEIELVDAYAPTRDQKRRRI